MIIYSAEQSIAHLIKNTSIAYTSKISKGEDSHIEIVKAKSEKLSSLDLFPLKSILVSTGWNKNDDVFDPLETWVARHTPEDKPFNYEHNPTDIIGHITGNHVIDDSSNLIDDNTNGDDLPNKFHIVTNAVLYKALADPDFAKRMNTIIAEIIEDKWFVSMEAYFSGFDYAVISGNEHKIIARNKETAFLTKHLRCYGGSGEYDGKKIGRLLRNIVFCGKGLVRNPANVDSVIFAKVTPFTGILNNNSNIFSFAQENVYNNSKEIIMSDLQKQVDEYKSEAEKQKAKAGAAEEALEATKKAYLASEKDLNAKIDASKKEVDELKSRATESEKKIKELEDQLKASNEKVANTEKDLSEANTKLKKAEDEKTAQARTASLVKELGLTEEDAKEMFLNLASLTDEQFTKHITLAKKTVKKEDKPEKTLANTKTNDIALNVGNDDIEKVYAEIEKYFDNEEEKE